MRQSTLHRSSGQNNLDERELLPRVVVSSQPLPLWELPWVEVVIVSLGSRVESVHVGHVPQRRPLEEKKPVFFEWITYRPGDCVFCGVKVFEVLWSGQWNEKPAFRAHDPG